MAPSNAASHSGAQRDKFSEVGQNQMIRAQDPMNQIVLMDSHHFTKLENLISNLNAKIWEYLHTILGQQVALKIVL